MGAQILSASANPLDRLEPCVTLGVCLAGARPSPPPSSRQSLCRFRNPCGSLRVRANAQKRSSTLRFRLPSSPFVSASRYGDFCEARESAAPLLPSRIAQAACVEARRNCDSPTWPTLHRERPQMPAPVALRPPSDLERLPGKRILPLSDTSLHVVAHPRPERPKSAGTAPCAQDAARDSSSPRTTPDPGRMHLAYTSQQSSGARRLDRREPVRPEIAGATCRAQKPSPRSKAGRPSLDGPVGDFRGSD